MQAVARDSAQVLVNELFALPTKRVEEAVLAVLPAPTTKLPREKPVPQPKQPTRWEEFAKAKGITKQKRSQKVWDDPSQSWKPRHGYDRVNDDSQLPILEVPNNAGAY